MGYANHARRGLVHTSMGAMLLGVGLLAAGAARSEARQPFDYLQIGPSDQLAGPIRATIGRWRTWVLTSGSELRPPAPPADRSAQTAAELTELRQLQAQRSPITNTIIQFWNSGPATQRWTELALSMIQRDKVNPVRAARLLAYLHTAMHDAVVATWDAKETYHRRAPYVLARGLQPGIPIDKTASYPSEHAAVAGAASAMLAHLFPNDAAALAGMEREACESRLLAGVNYRSDVEVGLSLGKAVAQKVTTRADADGSSAQFTGTVPTGPGFWKGANPLEPLAGAWKTWILTSGSQLRPGPPPTFGSAQFLTELEEVKRISSNATPAQRAIALFWADGAGTVTPPGHWFQIANTLIARDHLSTPMAARVLGLMGAAVMDAGISCWDCKYAYWYIRPVQADPTIVTIVPTPPFPSYTSGHSTFSGAASEVLAGFFPRDADRLRYMAEEAKMSRLYAGIHYRSDNEVGAQVGRRIGQMALDLDRVNGR
jgi:membrane-associated phospholipid phosphatase